MVLKSVAPDVFEGKINDKPITVRIDRETESSIVITVDGERAHFERLVSKPGRGGEQRTPVTVRVNESLVSPMPGRVVTLRVTTGQKVVVGDPLMTIESMKMETLLTSDREAVVDEVLVKEGQAIQRGQTLITFSKREG